MIHAIAAAALLLAQQPARPNMPCITRAEAADIVVFFLPTFIERTGPPCRASLPQTSFLSSNGPALAERLRREGGERWPRAQRPHENGGERNPSDRQR